MKVQIGNSLTWIFRQTVVQWVADGPIITIGKEFPKLCQMLFLSMKKLSQAIFCKDKLETVIS